MDLVNEHPSTVEDKLIVVTFKLPINIDKDEKGTYNIKPSKSILNTNLFNLQKRNPVMKTQWIGWPGIFVDDDKEQEQVRELLAKENCIPIFCNKKLVMDYLLFHEQILRPLFHNFTSLESNFEKDDEALWQAYSQFNFLYLEPIMSIMNINDFVWIHDTYLLLLPKYVRRQCINARIGFSMHSPFPSSDIYRMF